MVLASQPTMRKPLDNSAMSNDNQQKVVRNLSKLCQLVVGDRLHYAVVWLEVRKNFEDDK